MDRRAFIAGAGAAAVAVAVPVAEVVVPVEVPVPVAAMPEWLPCDGRALPISQFKELFDMIGRNYGGDETTFKLPDTGFDYELKDFDGHEWAAPFMKATGGDNLPAGLMMYRLLRNGKGG